MNDYVLRTSDCPNVLPLDSSSVQTKRIVFDKTISVTWILSFCVFPTNVSPQKGYVLHFDADIYVPKYSVSVRQKNL